MSNWIKQIQTNGTLQINNNQLFFPVNTGTVGLCMARWVEEVPVADQEVSYDLIFFDSSDVYNSNLGWETRLRWNVSTDTYYAVRFNYFTNSISIHRVSSGITVNTIANVSYSDWNPGQSYNIKIYLRGNTFDVLVNNNTYIANAQDNGISINGFVGIGTRFFGNNISNNGPHWDNFAIEFLGDLGIQMGGGYAPMAISIPATGGATISGISRIARRYTATGGVLISGISKIRRSHIAVGGIDVSGTSLTPRKYKAFGSISVSGMGKPGIHYKSVGGLATGGTIPYVQKITGIGLDEITITGEAGGPYTTGILNYNWLTYTVGKAITSGSAIYAIVTKNYHYVGSGGITTDGRALVGRKFNASGGLTAAGTYIYGSVNNRQNTSGGLTTDGSANVTFGYGGSGSTVLGGSAIVDYQTWTIVSSGSILITGQSIVKSNRFKYIPDLRLEIEQNLSGNKIKPFPVSTLGSGNLSAILNLSNNNLAIYLDYSLPASTATGIKLYFGNENENGVLALDIGALFGLSTPLIGSVTLPNIVRELIRFGAVYVVIESDAYPAGEIRTQYQPITPLIVSSANRGAIIKLGKRKYTASGGISVSGEVTTRVFSKAFHYRGSKEVEFVNNLSGNNVIPASGSAYSGIVDLIIDKKTYDFYITTLSKNNVVPPTSSSATGYAVINYDAENRILSWTITHQGLGSAITNITFNAGASGVNGPVIVNVPDFSNDNTVSPVIGSCTIRPDQYSTMLLGTYISIQTVNFPNGEIRGQFLPFATTLATSLTINHTIPADQIEKITLNCPANVNGVGPVVIDITNYTASFESPIVFQKAPINAFLTKQLCGGLGYLQISTFSKPDGELRANLSVKNGGATVTTTAITPGKAIGLGGCIVSGTAVIGRNYKVSGGITTGGNYGKGYRYTIANTVTITTGGSAVNKLVIFTTGGITTGGSAIVPLQYRAFGGITTGGSAIVTYILFGGGGVSISGSAKTRIGTRIYNPTGGCVISGNAIERTTRKYNTSGGCVISGTSLLINILNVIGRGGIDIAGEAVAPINHYHYIMVQGCVISGTFTGRVTANYNVISNEINISGIGRAVNIKFKSSDFSPGMNVRLVIGANLGTPAVIIDKPYPPIVQPRYCEFKNTKQKICKNGAFVPPSLRRRQKGYMPITVEEEGT